MSENGNVPTKIVELLITNINELSRQVQKVPERSTKDIETLTEGVVKVIYKLNTPPRNEELSVQIQKVDDKAVEITTNLTGINSSIKTMITTVKVAVAVMAAAVLLAGGMIQYGKYVDRKSVKQQVDIYLETKQLKSEIDVNNN